MSTITFTGPFTDEEIAAFVQVLRTIDQHNPASLYKITITDPDAGVMDWPQGAPGQPPPGEDEAVTTFARSRYSDTSCPPRACDHCQRTYQGPNIYCSFECAIADAA